MSIFTDSEAARFAAFRQGAAILRDLPAVLQARGRSSKKGR